MSRVQALEVYTWLGTRSASIQDPANWNPGSVPAFGTTLDACLSVGERPVGAKTPMNYTASQGTTTFALAKGGCSSIGHMGTAVLNVSGGILNFNCSEHRPEDEVQESLWVGNGPAPGNGTLNVSGGSVACKGGVILGRDGAIGALNISGGTVIIGSDGLNIGNVGPKTGTGRVTLSGSGNLVINGATPCSGKQAGISFPSGVSNAESFINFASGGTESLSFPTSADNFGDLLSRGYLKIDGVVATSIARFTKATVGSQVIYRVAAGSAASGGSTTPPVIEEDSNHEVLLAAGDGAISGHTAKMGFRQNAGTIIEDWSNPSDSIQWRAKVRAPGIFDVIMNYSAVAPEPGSLVEVAIGGQGVQERLDPTSTWDSYATKFLGQVRVSQAGVVGINLSALEKKGGWVMNLRSIVLRRSEDTTLQVPPKAAVHPALP